MPASIITLTTDFGLSDPYVASLRGVILSINPQATIVDVTHDILPQNIDQGAFVLAAAWPHFPSGSIHLVVVDPAVGTERRPIALITPSGAFVGPDNGILSTALPDTSREEAQGGPATISLPSDAHAFLLVNSRFHRQPVSATFHARDIFAPVAAHLSLRLPPAELGPEIDSIIALPPFRAELQPDGSLIGHVLHIDRFGNLITNIRAEQLPSPSIMTELCGRSIHGLARHYAEARGIAVLIGSTGFLEIASYRDSAARELGAAIGDAVVVRSV